MSLRLLKNMLFAAMPGLSTKVMNGDVPLTPRETIVGVALLITATTLIGLVEPVGWFATALQLTSLPLAYAMLKGAPDQKQTFPARHFVMVGAAAPMPMAIVILVHSEWPFMIAAGAMAMSTILSALATHIGKSEIAKPKPQNTHRQSQRPATAGPTPEALRAMRATEVAQLVEVGPIVGSFQGQEIPEWFIDTLGRQHRFTAVCPRPDLAELTPGQSIVYPGLIYTLTAAENEQR